jgi:hypothetical protein
MGSLRTRIPAQKNEKPERFCSEPHYPGRYGTLLNWIGLDGMDLTTGFVSITERGKIFFVFSLNAYHSFCFDPMSLQRIFEHHHRISL